METVMNAIERINLKWRMLGCNAVHPFIASCGCHQ